MLNSHHSLKLTVVNTSKVVNLVVNPSNPLPPSCLFFPGNLQHSLTFLEAYVICVKFGILNSPQSPDIGKSSDGGISDFWMSGQSLINKSCNDLTSETVMI